MQLSAPAYLFIGPTRATTVHSIAAMQRSLCPQQGCATCTICHHVRQRTHHRVMWISPDGTYTLEQFDLLFETIALAQPETEPFFFVITHADALSAACANRLLKSVEEPPTGYHFLFLAQREAMVLPTIRSRCIIQHITPTETAIADEPHADLLAFFKLTSQDALAFMSTLDRITPTEIESIDLVDKLLAYWIQQAIAGHRQAGAVVAILEQALKEPPMPGSSKIFWRNLFMRVHEIKVIA